jgi:hypothetical protein
MSEGYGTKTGPPRGGNGSPSHEGRNCFSFHGIVVSFTVSVLPMPRSRTLPKHPLLCATAKELADRIERYKASCTASDYRLANGAFIDARRLLVDVRNLLHSIRGLAGRR